MVLLSDHTYGLADLVLSGFLHVVTHRFPGLRVRHPLE